MNDLDSLIQMGLKKRLAKKLIDVFNKLDNTFELVNIKSSYLFKFDVINIIYNFYIKMNLIQKKELEKKINKIFSLENFTFLLNAEDFIENLDYLPYTCSLIEYCDLNEDELHELRSLVYTSLFNVCTSLSMKKWNNKNDYSNYLVITNAAYFKSLALKLNLTNVYENLLESFYTYDSYDDFVEYLYEVNEDNIDWDEPVDLDLLDQLIEEAENCIFIDFYDENDCLKIYKIIKKIENEYRSKPAQMLKSFDYIYNQTEIVLDKETQICGCDVYFCKKAVVESDRYILVFQNQYKFMGLLNDKNKWEELQNAIYHENVEVNNNKKVYIMFIIDDDTTSIPIQMIEANNTYGRKYVFTKEESITFINGISSIKIDDDIIYNPIHEWVRILNKVGLTGCLTELYFKKNVVDYLNGISFESDVLFDEDYDLSNHSKIVPIKWLKSIDTYGFRDFCFDEKKLEFGQINLFYGANGSGKTSVLEGIEFALTGNIRRVKDFKIEFNSYVYPQVEAYTNERDIIDFYPYYSYENSKEIEKIWYGIPVGRTKTTLNENFGRFNLFDSETVYNFIHNTDNSDTNFGQIFGNLLFGENVAGYEKKWLRYKQAFEETYSIIREELDEAIEDKDYYITSYNSENDTSHSDELESVIEEIRYLQKDKLPITTKRYFQLRDNLLKLEKHVNTLQQIEDNDITFKKADELITQTKKESSNFINQKNKLHEKIGLLYEDNKNNKECILKYEKENKDLKQDIDCYRTTVTKWKMVNNILHDIETINLVNELTNEKDQLDTLIYQINRIELYPDVIKYLNLENKDRLTIEVRDELNTEITEKTNEVNQLKRNYEKLLQLSSNDELNFIELRRLGLELSRNSKCPLCGNVYDDLDALIDNINDNILIDDDANRLINKINDLERLISLKQDILEQDNIIIRALKQLDSLKINNDIVEQNFDNINELLVIINNKSNLEKRKKTILDRLNSLNEQGFSLINIQACYQFKSEDKYYLNYLRSTYDDFDMYLNDNLMKLEKLYNDNEEIITNCYNNVSDNNSHIEIMKLDIESIENKIENLDIQYIRELKKALNTLNKNFDLDDDTLIDDWILLYDNLKCLAIDETSRIEKEDDFDFYKEEIDKAENQIKLLSPQVERCRQAISAFERMPTLSSFVEKSIKEHISLISKYFRWMHHSGEFTELGVDSEGIYAIRGSNSEIVRTYQMSTGQRASIAMSVLLALHIAAKNAPKFLLLDEPLATMDDIQVLNALDIFKALAEQGTQIFFTSANSEIIKQFHECFSNTEFDYKEYEFIKRNKDSSLIKENSINDVLSIEESNDIDFEFDFSELD